MDAYYEYNKFVACMKYINNEPYKVSTGICGSITIGYGKLDENGYWEFPLPQDIVNEIIRGKGLE